MRKVDFETNSEVNDYVEKFYYREEALCFVLGWDKYEPSEHKFAINLRWNFGDILNTRLP